jgi:hypothetical protein
MVHPFRAASRLQDLREPSAQLPAVFLRLANRPEPGTGMEAGGRAFCLGGRPALPGADRNGRSRGTAGLEKGALLRPPEVVCRVVLRREQEGSGQRQRPYDRYFARRRRSARRDRAERGDRDLAGRLGISGDVAARCSGCQAGRIHRALGRCQDQRRPKLGPREPAAITQCEGPADRPTRPRRPRSGGWRRLSRHILVRGEKERTVHISPPRVEGMAPPGAPGHDGDQAISRSSSDSTGANSGSPPSSQAHNTDTSTAARHEPR